MAAIVTEDPTEAAHLIAEGRNVVLRLRAGDVAPPVEGPGRLAVFCGDGAGAEEMAVELFGA